MIKNRKFGPFSPHELIEKWYQANQWEFELDKPGNIGPNNSYKNIAHTDYLHINSQLRDLNFELTAHLLADNVLEKDSRNVHLVPSLGDFICQNATHMISVPPHENLLFGNILLMSPLILSGVTLFSQKGPNTPFSWSMFWDTVENILKSRSTVDTKAIIKAIRIVNPGGLVNPGGKALNTRLDVFDPEIYRIVDEDQIYVQDLFRGSASFDLIASEFVNNFQICQKWLLGYFLPRRNSLDPQNFVEFRLDLFLHLLASFPDSHIYRKNTPEIAQRIQAEAQNIIEKGSIYTLIGKKLYTKFQHRLNSSHGKLNPGTTADFLAALLFLSSIFDLLPQPILEN